MAQRKRHQHNHDNSDERIERIRAGAKEISALCIVMATEIAGGCSGDYMGIMAELVAALIGTTYRSCEGLSDDPEVGDKWLTTMFTMASAGLAELTPPTHLAFSFARKETPKLAKPFVRVFPVDRSTYDSEIKAGSLTLVEAQKFVGGLVEVVTLPRGQYDHCVMLVNEEGRIQGLPLNVFASCIAKRPIAGQAVIMPKEMEF